MSGFNPLEKSIDDYHRQLRKAGLAFVYKVHDPVNITKKLNRSRVQGKLMKAEWVDWAGYLAGGRAVFHESKETAGASLHRGLFAPHQLKFLILAGKQGCLSFVSVRSKKTRKTYAVPAEILHGMPIKWAELESYVLRGVRWHDLFFT